MATVWSLEGTPVFTFLDGGFTPLKQFWDCLPLRSQDSHRDVAGGRCDLLILDSSLLWQTVLNAADKSTATQIVRSGGFLWVNPLRCMLLTATELKWSSVSV